MAPACYDLFFCQQCAPKSNSLRPSRLPLGNYANRSLYSDYSGVGTCVLDCEGGPAALTDAG